MMAGQKIKICLTVLSLGDRCGQSPGETEVQGQIGRHPPVILDKRPEQFPSATCRRAIESLIVDCASYLAKKKIGSRIASKLTKVDEETILESVRLDIHLLSADTAPHPNVVLAPNHVERVRDGENVGPALEGSKPAITQRPISAHQRGSQPTAFAILSRLSDDACGCTRAFAVDVCVDKADYGRLARPITK